jgi:hypothetical protein
MLPNILEIDITQLRRINQSDILMAESTYFPIKLIGKYFNN